MATFPPAPVLTPVPDLASALRGAAHDALVLVGPGPLSRLAPAGPLADALLRLEQVDASSAADRAFVLAFVADAAAPGGRLVAVSTGSLATWETDVRVFATAAAQGISRALAAGAKRPLLAVTAPSGDGRFARAREVAALGAAAALWEQYELRVSGGRPPRAELVGVVGDGSLDLVTAMELGRIVARDVCGTEPEVMSPDGMARYCQRTFEGTAVKVDVLADASEIAKAYPLIGAVARASLPVPRHHPRIIRLAYEPDGVAERTILLAGKGLVYDTGGADLKTDGHMAGMSRDKGGAAAVAGLLRVVAERRPKGVRVVGLLGAVRNSIGSDSFVTDEIVKSRAGVRVRIGNTDAEGRLVLADLLAALREEAEKAKDATLFSIATLTGHAALAHGPYTALLENGSARRRGIVASVLAAGDALGDPVERSSIRPEDYAFILGKSAAEDVLSCNSLPSSRTPRGHQFPAAFLDVVSGIRAHTLAGGDLGFVHVDIAGSAVVNGNWQTGTPTGAPVLALAEGLRLV